jgi:RNA polymerase sigma factor (sigma-70 family)
MTSVVACDRPVSFEALDDEELVFFFQNAGVERARGILAQRHLLAVYRYVERRLGRRFLTPEDREDMRQAAVLWFIDAIKTFDPRRLDTHPDLTFRTHWKRNVGLRLLDFLRRLRRDERRIDRSAEADYWLDGAPERILGRAWTEAADEQVAWEDYVWRVGQILVEHSEKEQRLWRLVAEGDSLRRVARKLGISYDAAKRCRRALLAALARHMSDER